MKGTGYLVFIASILLLLAACQPAVLSGPGAGPEQSATPTPAATPAPAEEEEEPEIEFLNEEEGGLISITGVVTYTNPFFTAGVAQPLILLEDQAGFVDRDTGYIFPLASQVLGQITSNFFESPFSYSMVLPIEPKGGQRDIDLDDEDEDGVQVFAVAYWNNTFGGPFLEERDLAGGGWSTAYASTRISEELETDREIIGGRLIVYAPDDAQSFPAAFGPDGLLFTDDDTPMVDLPQGYTVVNLDTDPFTFDRARRQVIDLIEPAGAALVDFSEESYSDAFDLMVADFKEKYAFTDIKEIDWDALAEEYRPAIEAAEDDDDPLAFRRALRDFLWNIPDGHVGPPVVIEDFRAAVAGGIGIGIRDIDDGRVIVNFIVDNGPAAEAGITLGTEIVAINETPISEWVDQTVAYSAPFSTAHTARLQKLRYATRFPAGSEVEVTFVNDDGEEETVTLDTIQEFNSFNQSSFFTGRTGFELPVQWELLDSGYVYAEITGFLDNQLLTVQLWERLMQNLNENEVPGLILDMRQNSGGFGFLADQMAAYFFDEPLVTGNAERYDEKEDTFIIREEDARRFILPEPELRYDGEVVVLVGPACASACEFFTYDLTLNGRATVVGQYPTAGLGGSVSELRMPAGEQIRYTTGRAVDADGSIHIEGIGVVPSVRVPVTPETLLTDDDVVLQAGIETLDRKLSFEPEIVGELVLGESITGTLEIGATLFYTLTVEEGDVINIYLEAADEDEYDPYLRLYAEDGTLLLENDDLNTKRLNAGFEELEIPFDLVLYLEVSAFDGESGGDFTLRAVRFEPPE